MINSLLTEKLRPKKLEHMILPKRIKDAFANGLQQNVLLTGTPGSGKTSLAKILSNDSPRLFINVSDESSVDTVRDKITGFCSTISIMDDTNAMKVVVLDEFDGASDQFYTALRGTMEKFAKNTRFVATCNWINKVPDPMKSRFEVFIFDPVNKEEEQELRDEWEKRIVLILSKLNISIDERATKSFVKKFYPDMRSALNCMQRWQIQGTTEITEEKVSESSWDYEELYEMLFQKLDPVKSYQVIAGQYSNSVGEVMESLGREFIEWIREKKEEKVQIIPAVLILVAQHQAQRTQVIDPVVSLLSLFYSIQKLTQ
jgi:replication factor C small subunit